MPAPKKQTRIHSTGVILGDDYEDTVHKKRGTATSVTEYLHGCARVCIEYVNSDDDVAEFHCDIGQLKHVRTKRNLSPRKNPAAEGAVAG